MLFTKSTILVTLFAAAQVAVATPPACLLAAVNTQQNPSDLASVCKASEVTSSLKSGCGSDYATAMTAFKAVCKGAGVTVAEPSVSHSRPRPTKIASSKKPAPTTTSKKTASSASHAPPRPTKVSSMTTKATAKPTATNSSGGSAPTSTGGSGGASSTGGAGGSSPTTSGSSGPAPSNAAGHLEAGAYLAMVAAGLVAAF